jgi:intracellular sulfur oxidation DsrE/DsrF family protein
MHMKQVTLLALAAGLLLLVAWYYLQPVAVPENSILPAVSIVEDAVTLRESFSAEGEAQGRAVLDISVHTIEGLKVLFDRAEELAMRPQAQGEEASVVLVLHGPEVEFFSIRNYEQYKDIVDQAARLDAFDVVDVKICKTMMGVKGIGSDDIPSFIEQVQLGPSEVERLLQEGYVAF